MRFLNGSAAKRLLTAAAAVFLLSVPAFAAEGELAVGAAVTTGSSLRMRSEPSADGSVMTYLDKDVTVAVLSGDLDGWYQISYNGRTGYVSADYLVLDEDNVFTTYGRAQGDGVNVRAVATTDAETVATLDKFSVVTVDGLQDGWYAVTLEDATTGYVRSDVLALTNSPSSYSGVVDYAMQFLGTRYVYGGSAPGGFDCSGFTCYVYKQVAGITLPRSASDQWLYSPGTKLYSIAELQPGDLVFFNDPSISRGKAASHASLYIGNGQIVHASSRRTGVITSDITSGYYNRYFVGGIRV